MRFFRSGCLPKFRSSKDHNDRPAKPSEFAMSSHLNQPGPAHFEVRFESLFRPGTGLAFPSDEGGTVDLDSLPQRARSNSLFARAMVGREFMYPAVVGA